MPCVRTGLIFPSRYSLLFIIIIIILRVDRGTKQTLLPLIIDYFRNSSLSLFLFQFLRPLLRRSWCLFTISAWARRPKSCDDCFFTSQNVTVRDTRESRLLLLVTKPLDTTNVNERSHQLVTAGIVGQDTYDNIVPEGRRVAERELRACRAMKRVAAEEV